MTKRALRIIGLLPLLFAMTVLGTGVSAAQTEPATLTRAKCWIKLIDESNPNWGQDYECELSIANPSEEHFDLYITFEGPDPEVHRRPAGEAEIYYPQLGTLVRSDPPASSATIQGKRNGKIEFEQIVPIPGSWP